MHAAFAFNGYFAHDDFVVTYRATRDGLGSLLQDYNGHLAPGTFALAWLVSTIAPLDFVVAMLPLLLIQAAAYVVFWRVLTGCFGHRWAVLVPFALFTCSPVMLAPTLWWAFAMQLWPTVLALVCALHAHLRYLRTGRGVLPAVLWTAAGLAFYEKAALIPLVLFAVTVLLAEREPPGAVADAVREHARVWLAHAALLGGFALLYFGLATPVQGRVNLAGLPELAGRMVVDSLVVPTLGLPVTGAGGEGVPQLADPSTVVRVLAVLVVVAAMVGGLLVRGRRAAFAWVFLGLYLAIDVGLVAVTRLPMIGPLIGADLRYIADAVPVLLLFATFAFLLPALRRRSAPEPRPEEPALRRRSASLAGAVAVLTVAAAIGATVSAVRLSPAMQFPTSREYVATARAALQERPGTVLYDGPVPAKVMLPWFGPEGVTSRVLGLLPVDARFDMPAERMYLVDGTGTPREITGVSGGISAPPGPVDNCGYGVSDQRTVIPLNGAVHGKRLARMRYYTSQGGPATVTAGGTRVQVLLKAGAHLVQFPVHGSFHQVEVERPRPAQVACVTEFVVGDPVTA